MQPLVRSSQTGYWIPACAGMTDNALEPSDHVGRCPLAVARCPLPVARCPLHVVFVGDCVTSGNKIFEKQVVHRLNQTKRYKNNS